MAHNGKAALVATHTQKQMMPAKPLGMPTLNPEAAPFVGDSLLSALEHELASPEDAQMPSEGGVPLGAYNQVAYSPTPDYSSQEEHVRASSSSSEEPAALPWKTTQTAPNRQIQEISTCPSEQVKAQEPQKVLTREQRRKQSKKTKRTMGLPNSDGMASTSFTRTNAQTTVGMQPPAISHRSIASPLAGTPASSAQGSAIGQPKEPQFGVPSAIPTPQFVTQPDTEFFRSGPLFASSRQPTRWDQKPQSIQAQEKLPQRTVLNQATSGAYISSQPVTSFTLPAKVRKVNAGAQPPSIEQIPPLPVPGPTVQYTQQAQKQPVRLPAPRPLLLIIDLNGTLVYRHKRQTKNFEARPDLRQFISYLIQNHYVMVWSSARPVNVSTMVEGIFTPDQRQLLVAEWGRDALGLSPEQYNNKTQVYKQLSWVWNSPQIQSSHPEARRGLRWDQTNTVLLDDSILKASAEPCNLVEVPEFLGYRQPDQVKYGSVLSQVAGYLEDTRYWADASAFIRANPFRVDERWLWPLRLYGDA